GVTSTLIGVTAVGALYNTSGSGPGAMFLTIEWRETFDQNAFNNSQLFQMMHTPWLRLWPAGGFSPDGSRVPLGGVRGDAAGNVTALGQDQRVQSGLPAGSVRFWRGASSSGMPQQATVDNQIAGEIGPLAAAGLTIRADTVTFRTLAGADNLSIDV